MEGEAGVLEQGVESPALEGRGAEPCERVGGDQQERIEAERQRRLGAERREQGAPARPPRQQRIGSSRRRQHRHPQQHRALVIPPRSRHLVDERLGAVAVLEHQCDRQIGPREHHQQHRKGDQRQPALHHRNRAHGAAGRKLAAQRRDHQHELQRRKPGGEPQRREAGFRDHRSSVFPALCSAARLPSSGGM